MLTQVADGVLVHVSQFCRTNAVVVDGADGVLLVDPGVHGDELDCLAADLSRTGRTVVAGFSTHPHWDHLLWHAGFGAPPRLGTAACASFVRDRLAQGVDPVRLGIPEQVPLDLLGGITGLPEGATRIPWEGPAVRVVEHNAHAPGHAALVIEDRGVLVAGDMLSDVLVPMLDLLAGVDPVQDYLAALDLLEDVVADVDVVVPGHGSVAGPVDARARVARDRDYVHAVRDGREVSDPRLGASAEPGWEWVSDVHAGQLQRLAARDGQA